MTEEKPSCPECGAETVFEEREARLLQGSCAGCGRAFTIVQHAPEHRPPLGTPGEEDEDDKPSADPEAPACGVCGSSLTVRASSETSLEVTCPSCETRVSYVLDQPGAPPRERRFVPRGGGPRDDRDGPRARPCRECGGPLSFSTDEEGNVTGECGSCGNRFTLPPRPRYGGGGGGRGPPRRDGGRGFGRGGGGRSGGWRPREGRGPPRYDRRGGGGGYARRDRDDGDDDDRPRRRRPRPE